MTVPDQPLAASGIGLVGMGGEKSGHLGLDRLGDQRPRTLAQQIRQRVRRKSGRRPKRDNPILQPRRIKIRPQPDRCHRQTPVQSGACITLRVPWASQAGSASLAVGIRHVAYRSPSPAVLEPVAHPLATLFDQWRDMAYSQRYLRRVNNALICHPIQPSPTFSDGSRASRFTLSKKCPNAPGAERERNKDLG